MSRKNGYVKLGLTVFLTVSAILLVYDTLMGRRVLPGISRQLITAMQPIAVGAMLAYLLVPLVNFFERTLVPEKLQNRSAVEAGSTRGQLVRAGTILLTWLIIGAAVYLLASVLVPELYRSVLQLVGNVENYYNTINGWMQHLLETNPDVEKWVMTQMDTYYQDVTDWLRTEALPQAQNLMMAVSGGVVSIVSFLKNLLVGIIVSIYLLATKERCAAYGRKLIYGLFGENNARWMLRGVRKADSIFSGFVRGKLMDSLIIGLLCFAGCTIFDFPYKPLVSVFIGVTNIIPFFGPFLGAIPSIFLILLASPMKALYFALFVLALQQLDGNVIGPKILGDKTGLSSLWVIIAILVGGSFFGVPGMFFGVPVCACIHTAVNFLIEARLRDRHLPTDTDAYDGEVPTEKLR